MHHSRVLRLLHNNLESPRFIVVVLRYCNLFLRFQILQLNADSLQLIDLYFKMFGKFEVFIVHRNLLINLKLPYFVLCVCVVESQHHFCLACDFEVIFVEWRLFLDVLVGIQRSL